MGLIPGLGRSPGEEKGYPLQYSGLESSRDYSPWGRKVGHNWATFTFYFHSNSWGLSQPRGAGKNRQIIVCEADQREPRRQEGEKRRGSIHVSMFHLLRKKTFLWIPSHQEYRATLRMAEEQLTKIYREHWQNLSKSIFFRSIKINQRHATIKAAFTQEKWLNLSKNSKLCGVSIPSPFSQLCSSLIT